MTDFVCFARRASGGASLATTRAAATAPQHVYEPPLCWDARRFRAGIGAAVVALATTLSAPAWAQGSSGTSASASAAAVTDSQVRSLDAMNRSLQEVSAATQAYLEPTPGPGNVALSEGQRRRVHQAVVKSLTHSSALRAQLQAAANPRQAQSVLGAPAAEPVRRTLEQRASAYEAVANRWLQTPDSTGAQALRAYFAANAHTVSLAPGVKPQAGWSRRAPARPTLGAGLAPVTRQSRAVPQAVGASARERLADGAAASTASAAALQFTSAPSASQAPAAADLGQDELVRITAPITALAQSLDNSPVRISNWVHNQIRYVPGWGATQSAEGVLQSRQGNAIDIATLHIALLRAAQVPARYQFGSLLVPIEQAQNWLGGLRRPQAVLDVLAQAGVGAQGIVQNGQFSAVAMDHVWVQAYVYWAPGRGARSGGAQLVPPQHPHPNAQLNAWVPIDASYKQLQHTEGRALAEFAPLNAQALFDGVKQGAQCSAQQASGLRLDRLAATYSDFVTGTHARLSAAAGAAPLSQLLGTSATIERNLATLAGTLPHSGTASAAPISQLPAALVWQLGLALQHDGQNVLATTQTVAQLAGKVLSLRFEPASAADAQELARLLKPQDGSATDAQTALAPRIAAYTVQLKAQLWLDEQLLAQSSQAYGLGQTLQLRSDLQGVDGAVAGGLGVPVVVGETHAWVVHPTRVSAASALASAERVRALLAQTAAGTPAAALPSRGRQATALLRELANAYQGQLDATQSIHQRIQAVQASRQPAVVRLQTRLQPEQAFGIVTGVRSAGLALQLERWDVAAVSRAQDAGATAEAFAQQSQERASAAAHQLLNSVLGAFTTTLGLDGPAQSAVATIAQAARSGPIVRADASNWAASLAGLEPDSGVRILLQGGLSDQQQALFTARALSSASVAMEGLIVSDPAADAWSYTMVDTQAPRAQLSAHRPHLSGWLGLADEGASAILVQRLAVPLLAQLNTVATLAGPGDTHSWNSYAGRQEVLDAAFQARVREQVNSANACDWLISVASAQLAQGLPPSERINRAPVITSAAVELARAGQSYLYAVQASDPDGDTLSYALVAAPAGLSIDGAGVIRWSAAVVGSYDVDVRVSDGAASARQLYRLVVSETTDSLRLNIALSPAIANAGQTVALYVSASTDQNPPGLVTTASFNGQPVSLSPAGQAVLVAPAAGTHRVIVTTQDASGAQRTREVLLTVRDPAATGGPEALISTPLEDEEVRGIVSITGTARAPRFAYYQLLLRPAGAADDAWKEIGRSLTPVDSAVLGTLDTSVLANGQYQIALRSVDVNGSKTVAAVTVGFAGNLKLGQFRLSFVDLRAEAPGFPLMLTRTYDSTKKDVLGDFGWGWSASAQDVTVRKNVALGVQWQVVTQGFQLCLRPTGKRRVSISLPDGGFYRFDARNAQECQSFQVPQANVIFDPVPGPTGGASAGRMNAGASLRANDGALVMAQGGMLVNADTGEPWNPLDFLLTTEDGVQYGLREGVGVLYVIDAWGNRVDYGANGYSHNANLRVQITRDAQGRIVEATDPQGRSVRYGYNSQGELVSVTDRAGLVTRLGYASVPGVASAASSGNRDHEHLLASITDPRGQVVMANQFDTLGRLSHSSDALGQVARQEFDLGAPQQRVINRRGFTTVYDFDADGNVTRLVDALGHTSHYTYDANGNETSAVNPLGETITRAFDPSTGKLLTETNALGHSVSTRYPATGQAHQRQNPLSSTDALGNVTSYSYQDVQRPGAVPYQITEPLGRVTGIGLDFKGNLGSLNVAGEITVHDHDAQGRKIRETNALGHTVTFAYDAVGNETERVVYRLVGGQIQRLVTSRRYDAQDRVIEEADPLGAITRHSYNAAGKPASSTDALGRVTRYHYDANARLIRTEHPDGSAESTEYDAEGNETARIDRAGRVTRMFYDGLNRLIRTEYPDGSAESTEYDAAGRVSASTDRNGRRSRNQYDSAGRLIAAIDATGRITRHGYDANGNRTETTVGLLDAGAATATLVAQPRTTEHTYDALNRLVSTRTPSGALITRGLRPDNRKHTETDARQVQTGFDYDGAGRLVSVTQYMGAAGTTDSVAITRYTYDETAAKTRQIDALGRTTTWTTDNAGRIDSRTLQDGSVERMRYDSAGNRLSHQGFDGVTTQWSYDLLGRPLTRLIGAGVGSNAGVGASQVSWQYGPSGQVTLQNEQGAGTSEGTISRRYDSADRLLGTTTPAGQLSYDYDGAGQILRKSVSIQGRSVGTAGHEYDGAGRLIAHTAPDGTISRYFHDSAGRLIRTERALQAVPAGQPLAGERQSLITHYRYDDDDLLTAIAHVRRIGASADTDTVLAGQALSRVPGGAITQLRTYRGGAETAPALRYDSASGQFSGAAGQQHDYEYDANARLTRETITAATGALITDTRYRYDSVGNRIGRAVTDSAGTTHSSYEYDSADRLVRESTLAPGAASAAVTVYGWDAAGRLASRSEGSGRTVLYRWDGASRLIDLRTGASAALASAAAPLIRYGYDADGLRVRKHVADSASGATRTVHYLLDTSAAYAQVAARATTVQELGGASRTARSVFHWGAGSGAAGIGLIRQEHWADGDAGSGTPTALLLPLQGHLGTSLGAVDAHGQVVEAISHDAFGQRTDASAAAQSHRFAGEYWDEDAQLVYLRARWYDPRLGRFISGDPFEGRPGDPRSLNRYSYAHGDPVHGADPSGETTAGESGAVLGGVGALSSAALPTVGAYLAAAKTTHLAIASVPFMAMHGPRITQFIQGSGRAGFDALQRSVFMVARGGAASQQQIQSAWNLGSAYTSTLNRMMGARATQFGMEIHKLVEGNMRLPANFTYSLANLAPTPYQVHKAISALHSSKMFASGPSMTVRQYLARELASGRLTPEQVYRIEAQIWAAAMQGQRLTAQWVLMLTRSVS